MQELRDRILKDGRALNGDVLLVDSFLNHRIDPLLMQHIGEEFARHFRHRDITLVATIEASGIAPSVMAAQALGVPLLVMKKAASSIMQGDLYSTQVHSFTKNTDYTLTCKKAYISAGDRVLFIDDFLAAGEAGMGAARIIESAGATVEGIGIVIEKSFQKGANLLRESGYDVYSLARIQHMDQGVIEFAQD